MPASMMAKSIRLIPVIRESSMPSVANAEPILTTHSPKPALTSAVTRGASDSASGAGPTSRSAETTTAARQRA